MEDGPHRQLQGRSVAPVHHPLEGVEVAKGGLWVLGPVGAVLLVIGAAQVHGHADAGFVHARPEGVELGVGHRASAEGVVPPAVGVAGLELDDGGALVEDGVELGHGEIDVGEGDVGREEHAVPVGEPHLLVHPSVEGPDVGVEGLDVVGQLVLDVVGGRGIHEGRLDALVVHQGQAEVAVPIGLALLAELCDQLPPLVLGQPLQRVETVEQHPGHHRPGRRSVPVVGDGAAEHPL